MSLVIAVGNKDFVLLCGEQKAMLSDGKSKNKFNKVIRINNNCLIGIAGNVEGIQLLTEPILSEINKVKKEARLLSYEEINCLIKEKYNKLLDSIKEGEVSTDERVFVTIAGFDSNCLRMDAYFYPEDKCVDSHLKLLDLQLKYFVMSKCDNHAVNFKKNSEKNIINSIDDFVDIFKITCEEGMKFDNSINNNCDFELIARNDF